jgi:hypothetical protein
MRRCAADRDRPRTATRGGTRRPRARYPRCARAARSAPAPAPAPPPSAHSSPARSQTHRPAPHALPRHTQPPYRRHPAPRFRQPHTHRRPAGKAERFRVVGMLCRCARLYRGWSATWSVRSARWGSWSRVHSLRRPIPMSATGLPQAPGMRPACVLVLRPPPYCCCWKRKRAYWRRLGRRVRCRIAS